MGSPPRMRGKGQALLANDAGIGITPAYAGKRHYDSNPPRHPRDHPRVCGEKRDTAVCLWSLPGSPPRMRGKEEVVVYTEPENGITPAYAGKSYEKRLFLSGSWDHPRVCGEKTKKIP